MLTCRILAEFDNCVLVSFSIMDYSNWTSAVQATELPAMQWVASFTSIWSSLKLLLMTNITSRANAVIYTAQRSWPRAKALCLDPSPLVQIPMPNLLRRSYSVSLYRSTLLLLPEKTSNELDYLQASVMFDQIGTSKLELDIINGISSCLTF